MKKRIADLIRKSAGKRKGYRISFISRDTAAAGKERKRAARDACIRALGPAGYPAFSSLPDENPDPLSITRAEYARFWRVRL